MHYILHIAYTPKLGFCAECCDSARLNPVVAVAWSPLDLWLHAASCRRRFTAAAAAATRAVARAPLDVLRRGRRAPQHVGCPPAAARHLGYQPQLACRGTATLRHADTCISCVRAGSRSNNCRGVGFQAETSTCELDACHNKTSTRFHYRSLHFRAINKFAMFFFNIA